MRSRDTWLILVGAVVLLPASMFIYPPLDRLFDLPSWVSWAIPVSVCMLAPKLYVQYVGGDRSPR